MVNAAARAMSGFDSLTLALDGWFETSQCDLPDALRLRVEREFLALPWDQRSAAGRRLRAYEWDLGHDPAMAEAHQFWWDFGQKILALKKQRTDWEATTAPTATDLAMKESRLEDLGRELARMELQQRQAKDNYEPELGRLCAMAPASEVPDSPVRYVAYPKAMAQLRKRLDATPEELAAWIWIGPKDGGIAAYVNANELDPPPRFYFGVGYGKGDDHDCVSPLMDCWCREDDLAGFKPADRYITGAALIARWSATFGVHPEAFIRAKIKESRLQEIHPIYGLTQGSLPEKSDYPPMASGLFDMTSVRNVELEDFSLGWEPSRRLMGEQLFGVDQTVGLDSPIGVEASPRVFSLPQPFKDASTPSDPLIGERKGEAGSDALVPCAAFRAMKNLKADELKISFVGDKADFALAANNLLEVAARKQVRRVALAELGLIDLRKGGLNSQGAILLGMAQGKRFAYTSQNATKMKRLRDALRRHFGLTGDPFHRHQVEAGWLARFEILDRRGAADERAKRDAERRTVSLDQLIEQGVQFADDDRSQKGLEEQGDPADSWLKANDPDGRA